MGDIEDAVSVRLRAVMAHFEMSGHAELAELCGAGVSAVGMWLRGSNLPRVDEMIRLCQALNLSLDWIYSGERRTVDANLETALWKRITEGRIYRKVHRSPGRWERPEAAKAATPQAPKRLSYEHKDRSKKK